MKNYIFIFLTFYFTSFSINALDINKTISNAVNNNISIKITLEEINEAKELIHSSLGNFRPDISISLKEKQSTTETITSTSSNVVNKLSDTYSITINQNLYSAGRNKLDLEKSRILFNNQIINFYISLNNLILQAINGYLTVQVNEKTVESTEKTYEVAKNTYDDALAAKELGTLTIVDLNIAESSLEQAKSNLILSKGNLNIGKITFKNIVGLEAVNLEKFLNINYNSDVKKIEKNALLNNYDLKILNNNFLTAQLDFQIKKKDKYPTLDLTGDVSYNDNVSSKGTETTSGSISATLSIPIYQQGIEHSEIRKYQSKLIQSELIIEDKIEQIKLNSFILYNNFNYNKSKLQSTSLKVIAAKNSLRAIEKQYEAGTKTFTDLIYQEEVLLLAKLDNLNANKDLILSYFEILAFEGKLLDTFNEYLPKIE